MEQLQEGQEYSRWVWRPNNRTKDLVTFVEHVHERDCPWEDLEAMGRGEPEEYNVSAVVEMVMTSKVVAQVTMNGETEYKSVPVVEMVTRETDEQFDDGDGDGDIDYGPYNPDDDIPF